MIIVFGREKNVPTTLLYILIGTFMTRLTLFALADPDPPAEPARQVPITSSYENFRDRPLNVGGRLSGSSIEYVSATI